LTHPHPPSLVKPLMNDAPMPQLDAGQLQRLAHTPPSQCQCALRACLGWDSVSNERWPEQHMRGAGTLRQPLPEGQTEASFEEHHPQGTRYDSPQAPIALDFFPFNRCDVYICTRCGCAALKYTEFGGYYVDHRVRLVDAQWVVVDAS
jgi:hypothetical protein